MLDKNANQTPKPGLHSRNPHRFRYDFPELIRSNAGLEAFVFVNDYSNLAIDFTNQKAVKALNRALLKSFYNVSYWDIPEGFLCPPIPGRADYIHYMADLLAASNDGNIPKGKQITVLDIGVGANCIYPLIGHAAYGWNFIGSEIEKAAIEASTAIVEANSLSEAIEIRRQPSKDHFFKGIIKPGELVDLSICNPPFHSSAAEAAAGSSRKWKNLGKQVNKQPLLNFGGNHAELWCKGGEEQFLVNMITESTQFSANCCWFTSLVSKKTTLPTAYKLLQKVKAVEVKTILMSQGQKVSRVLAWTFLSAAQQKEWQLKRWMK